MNVDLLVYCVPDVQWQRIWCWLCELNIFCFSCRVFWKFRFNCNNHATVLLGMILIYHFHMDWEGLWTNVAWTDGFTLDWLTQCLTNISDTHFSVISVSPEFCSVSGMTIFIVFLFIYNADTNDTEYPPPPKYHTHSLNTWVWCHCPSLL